jgi:hypothetical protein
MSRRIQARHVEPYSTGGEYFSTPSFQRSDPNFIHALHDDQILDQYSQTVVRVDKAETVPFIDETPRHWIGFQQALDEALAQVQAMPAAKIIDIKFAIATSAEQESTEALIVYEVEEEDKAEENAQ